MSLPGLTLTSVFVPGKRIELFAPCVACNTRGCPHCNRLRAAASRLNASPDFIALARAAAQDDAVARQILLDWCIDQVGEPVRPAW